MSSAPNELVSADNRDRSCLLVVLRPKLMLAPGLLWPLKRFRLGETEYHDVGLGEWTAFYDWLRDSWDNLIGVRYYLEAETQYLLETTRRFDYVRHHPIGYVEIFFSSVRHFVPERSCDQAFMYDAVFRSVDGETAMGFDMQELNETNLQSLKQAEAEWAVPKLLE